MDWRKRFAGMLSFSPRKIAALFIFTFFSLISVRHVFHAWQSIDNQSRLGYEAEQNFDELFPILKWIERTDYDLHLRAHKVGKPNPNVVVVEINERSLQEIGQFPFSRNVYGRLLDNLRKAGAKVVAFDMSFSEEERNEGLKEMKKLRAELPGGNSSIFQLVDQHIRNIDNDQSLAEAVSRTEMPVLVGFTFAGVKGTAADLAPEKKLLVQKHAMRTSQVNRDNFGVSMTGYIPTVPNTWILEKLPKGNLGHFIPDPDSDSVIRQVPIVVEYDSGFYPSLAVQAVAKYLNTSFTLKRDGNLWLESADGKVNVPLSRSRMLPRYYGEARQFKFVEFADIYKGVAKELDEVKGKIVFIGATAQGLKDIRATPFSADYPGVEVHATIASNILNGEYMVRDTEYFYVGYLLVLACGLALSFIVFKRHPVVSFLSTLVMVGAMQFVTQHLFFNQGIVVPTLVPTLEMASLLFTGILYRYFTEENEKKFVRTAFSRYVSGAVVEELIKDQSKLQLGGQKKELTVMFSDLAGFTKLSEKLDAGFVTTLLNEYFTRMTKVVQQNQGTLDKYMGDGIMCFWGAPLDLPKHATLACRAALEMTRELAAMNTEWKQKHGLTVGMRIGVHTGDMAVGNMGSEKVFSYTVMGDNVNLCSRLEGVNTVYGTQVIVSAETAVRASDAFLFRFLDTVRVKGKEEAVKIYELIDEKGVANPARDEWLHAFEAGLSAYHAGRWEEAKGSFGAVLALKPEDGPAKAFIERVNELMRAPQPDWDGVWKLHSK